MFHVRIQHEINRNATSPRFILSIGLCGSNMGLYFTAEHFKANPIRWRYVTAGDITLSSPAWDGRGAPEGAGGESSGAWEATARPGPAALSALPLLLPRGWEQLFHNSHTQEKKEE